MSALQPSSSANLRVAYEEQGYVLLKGLFSAGELQPLQEALDSFHTCWLQDHENLYHKGAINSAYLTDSASTGAEVRRPLFRIIGDARIDRILQALCSAPPAFLNTQLFFNPADPQQPNYWHRDIQYTGLSLAEQQAQLTRIQVLHLRLALRPEPGLELVPGTHRRWDSEEEFAIRMRQGRRVNEPLPDAQAVPLSCGDVLVFSANMLHRGLYGMDRFAFDMLFCDAVPELLQYARRSCLPREEDLAGVDCPQVFTRTRQVLDSLTL